MERIWIPCCWVLMLLLIGMFPQVGDAVEVHSQARGKDCDILIVAPTERGHKGLAISDPPASVCVEGWFSPMSATVIDQTVTINGDVEAVLAGKPGFRLLGGGGGMEIDAGKELLQRANSFLSEKGFKADDFWTYHELRPVSASPDSGTMFRTPLNPPPGGTEVGSAKDCYTLAELEQMKKQAIQWAMFMKNSFLPKHGVK